MRDEIIYQQRKFGYVDALFLNFLFSFTGRRCILTIYSLTCKKLFRACFWNRLLLGPSCNQRLTQPSVGINVSFSPIMESTSHYASFWNRRLTQTPSGVDTQFSPNRSDYCLLRFVATT